jgi:hypothetical protein
MALTSNHTKHVDIGYHYVRNYIHEGLVKIDYVRFEENKADFFTKNLGSELYLKHRDALILKIDINEG